MYEVKYGIAWNDNLKVGDENVDAQHKMLFDLLNVIISRCIDGSSIEMLQDTLDFLANYTIQHFYDEETLQIRHNFPEYGMHKKLHEDFKLVVDDLIQRFAENGSSQILCDDVNKIVVRWLVGHIQQEDRKIGQHIRLAAAQPVSACV